MKKNMYWIGGSPCSGKSTIAEMLVKAYDFKYYKCDDYLERYLNVGVEEKDPLMLKISTMSQDEIWLRNVEEQVHEEFDFYRYALEIIKKDVEEQFPTENVIIEGAAILPEFIKANGIEANRYICMTPSSEFQIEKYSERTWVKSYLSDCSDWEKAFQNWMARDIEYAKVVRREAVALGYQTIQIDGSRSNEEIYSQVFKFFSYSNL